MKSSPRLVQAQPARDVLIQQSEFIAVVEILGGIHEHAYEAQQVDLAEHDGDGKGGVPIEDLRGDYRHLLAVQVSLVAVHLGARTSQCARRRVASFVS